MLCGPFDKIKERLKKFKERGDSKDIYKNELDKAWFHYGMAYGDFKDLPKRTSSDKVLCDKAFNIAKNQKYDGNQRGLASVVYKFFDKISAGEGIKNKLKQNGQLAEELHKAIIKKFEKWKVHSPFKDNIWGVYLADM